MAEFRIGEDNYRAEKLSPLKQLKIAKRLLGALGKLATPAIVPVIRQAMAESDGNGFRLSADDVVAVLPVIIEAVSTLSDNDAEVIILTAMSAVSRHDQRSDGWMPLTAPHNGNPVLAFQDIDLSTMMQITYRVIAENLGSFFPAPRSGSSEAGEKVKASN